MGILDGKIAIITGAGQGLGEGAAHAMTPVSYTHLQVDVPGKISPNMLQYILPQDQRLAEGLADGLLGKIVIGGAKAAGGKDDVRSLPGLSLIHI